MGLKSSVKIQAGFIMPYAGATPPAGWLVCAGQAVSRTAYAALFLAIGTTHGVGDGSTTFNLPDLRGRAVFGKDNMNGSAANRLTTAIGGVDGVTLGAVGGGQSVTLTEAQMPAHTHTAASSDGTGGPNGLGSQAINTDSATSSKGSSAAHQNIPPAIVTYMLIKF